MRYIKEHPVWILGCFFLVFTVDIFLMTLKGSVYLMLYFSITAILIFMLGLYLDYRRYRTLFAEIVQKMEQLDQKYLVPEVIGEDGTQEKEMLLGILKDAEHSMAENVSAYRRDLEEYKEYIETWVHEIKIPISTLKLMAENDHAGAIDTEVDRIDRYVEQALYYARSAAVEKDFFIRQIDIRDLVRREISKRKRSFIALHTNVQIGEEMWDRPVKSDEKWIGFIVGQILDNSIKYAKEGEALHIRVKFTSEDGRNCLQISDNGIGMKASETARAFEKGFTGSNGRSGRSSTGMGLYLCRKLCNRLEHEIRIVSEEGEGTTVSIRF
jgi:hypothetical protein